jgi:predicted phosphodiesterase
LPPPIAPEHVRGYVTLAQGLAWTHGALAATGWLDWLATLPLEQRLTLPNGTRVLGVHASPGCDDGLGMERHHSDDELMARFSGGEDDLIFVGHCHSPQDRHIGNMHLVEVGSVSNPRGDLRASYALLEADASGYQVTLHRVAYDTEAVIRAIQEHHFFPNPDWLIGKFIAQA